MLEQTATSAKLEMSGEGIVIEFTAEVAGDRVKMAMSASGSGAEAFNKSSLAFEMDPANERFFGLGERFATVDHRG